MVHKLAVVSSKDCILAIAMLCCVAHMMSHRLLCWTWQQANPAIYPCTPCCLDRLICVKIITWTGLIAENAQRQAQQARQAQIQAAEEEAKASKLADQAEQRAVTEQGSGNLTAAVAASSAAAK